MALVVMLVVVMAFTTVYVGVAVGTVEPEDLHGTGQGRPVTSVLSNPVTSNQPTDFVHLKRSSSQAYGGAAFDPTNGFVYVTEMSNDTVGVYNGTSDVPFEWVPVGEDPTGIAYDPADDYLFAADSNSSEVNMSVIDGATNAVVPWTESFPGGSPQARGDGTTYDAVLYDAHDGNIYVTISGLVKWTIPFTSQQGQIHYNIQGTQLAYDPTNWDVYFDQWGGTPSGSIFECGDGSCSSSPVVQGDFSDEGIAFDTSNGDLYVAGAESEADSVVIASVVTGTVVASVNVSGVPGPMTFDPSNGYIYVTMLGGDTVVVIDGSSNTIVETLQVGKDPHDIAYDPLTENLYVPCNGVVSVVPTIGPLSVSLVPARLRNDVNETLLIRAVVSGGQAPFSYSWSTTSTTSGCGQSSSFFLNCTPKAMDSFTVWANVTDALGNRVGASSPTIVLAPALRVTFGVSSPTPLLAQTVAFSANASGGAGPPYTFNYSGLPYGCYSQNKTTIGCLPTQSDWYNVTVTARDSNNGTANATVTIHVIFDFNVVVPASTALGQQLTILVNTNQTFHGGNSTNKTTTAIPAGGYGTLSYNYTGLPPGCSTIDAAELSCYPSQTGTYQVTVAVRDQAGDHNAHTVTVTIVPGFLGLPGNDGYYLLVGVSVVAVLVPLVVVIRRRRRGGNKSGKEKEDVVEETVSGSSQGSDSRTTAREAASSPSTKSEPVQEAATPATPPDETIAIPKSEWEDMKAWRKKVEQGTSAKDSSPEPEKKE